VESAADTGVRRAERYDDAGTSADHVLDREAASAREGHRTDERPHRARIALTVVALRLGTLRPFDAPQERRTAEICEMALPSSVSTEVSAK